MPWMRIRRVTGIRLAAVACAAVVSIVLVTVPVSTQSGRYQIALVDGREAVAGEVLVKFRDSSTATDRARVEQDTSTDDSASVGSRGARRMHSRRLDISALVAYLRVHPQVEYVEPNYIVYGDAMPNDPKFGTLWGLFNTGQTVNGAAGTAGADIGAVSAWDVTTGSRANVVAVVDTGVDYNHPDLTANIWSAPAPFSVTIGGVAIACAAGTHGYNALLKTCDPMDDNNHGTHVAGTIGASGNNAVGVAGVNWTASIMAAKFLGASGSGTTADAIDAIEFTIQAKAAFASTHAANVRVLSNSWGGGGFSQALLDEINKANTNDMLFVAAAGNSGRSNDASPTYPASFNAPNVLAVAATDSRDRLASFSNYGATTVHLAAPGVNIQSTTRNNTYTYFSGTSMATPHVSGAAALVLSACGLTTATLKTALLTGVDILPNLAGRVASSGRLDVARAIAGCRNTQIVTFAANRTVPQQAGTTITFTAAAAGGTAPYEFKWFVNDGSTWTTARDWNASSSFAWTPLTANSQYIVRVWVRSAGNLNDAPEASRQLLFPIVRPLVSHVTLGADKHAPQTPGTTITFSAAPTGGVTPYAYKWRLWNGHAWSVLADWRAANTFVWTPATANGEYVIDVWVRGAGNAADAPEASDSVYFPIEPPRVTAVTLAANKTSPQARGTAVTWTATPAGGVTPYQYKWWILDGASRTVARDWSASNTFIWTPATARTYRIVVGVRSAGNTSRRPEAQQEATFVIR